MSQTIQELYNLRQTKFIEARSTIKHEVDQFLESVKATDPSVFVGLEIPAGNTAEEILPSLWVEPFNQEQYNQELAKLNAFIAQIHIVTDRLNQEALECLQKSS